MIQLFNTPSGALVLAVIGAVLFFLGALVPFAAVVGIILLCVALGIFISTKLHSSRNQDPSQNLLRPRWQITLLNVLSVFIAAPVLFFGMFIATMASDSGPNIVSNVMVFGLFLIFMAVIVCITVSQAKRSLTWALWGNFLPLLIPVFFFIFEFLFLILYADEISFSSSSL